MDRGRYFFALWPELEVCKQLTAVARQFNVAGRLHHPLDLHMTLVYLGQVAGSQMRCIEEVGDSIVGRSFTMLIDGIGYWSRPRILWAGPREIPEPLTQLVFDMQQGLGGCGFEPERRRYKPHVTLYRKSQATDPMVINPAVSWSAAECVLAVSGLNKPGEPRYRIVKRWPLSDQT